MLLRNQQGQHGLAKALDKVSETTVPPGVRHEFSVTGDDSAAPLHVRNQFCLIMREAMRNAVTHSGAGLIEATLTITPEGVSGAVEDDGAGFDGSQNGHGNGLRSMKERAEIVGGTLKLRSAPGEGTRVRVFVPTKGDHAGGSPQGSRDSSARKDS